MGARHKRVCTWHDVGWRVGGDELRREVTHWFVLHLLRRPATCAFSISRERETVHNHAHDLGCTVPHIVTCLHTSQFDVCSTVLMRLCVNLMALSIVPCRHARSITHKATIRTSVKQSKPRLTAELGVCLLSQNLTAAPSCLATSGTLLTLSVTKAVCREDCSLQRTVRDAQPWGSLTPRVELPKSWRGQLAYQARVRSGSSASSSLVKCSCSGACQERLCTLCHIL